MKEWLNLLHPEKIGNRTRMSFSKIKDVMDLPYLIEIQKSSYDWFFGKRIKRSF